MKKLNLFLPILLTCTLLTSITAFADSNSDIKVIADGEAVVFDAEPIIENGRTLVPIRAISETLDAEVEWDQATKQISLKKGKTTNALTIGSIVATKTISSSSENIELEVAPKIYEERTYVPLRYLSESFGLAVEWDEATRTVTLTSPDEATEVSTILETTTETTELSTITVKDDFAKLDIELADKNAQAIHHDVRNDFEQTILSGDLYKDRFGIIKSIQNKDVSSINTLIDSAWEQPLHTHLTDYMFDSDYQNLAASGLGHVLYFNKLMTDFSLEKEKNYDMKIVELGSNTNVAIMKLSDINERSLCVYIGIVPTQYGKIRYFTLKKDFYGKYLFQEVDINGSGKQSNDIFIDNDLQAFANAIIEAAEISTTVDTAIDTTAELTTEATTETTSETTTIIVECGFAKLDFKIRNKEVKGVHYNVRYSFERIFLPGKLYGNEEQVVKLIKTENLTKLKMLIENSWKTSADSYLYSYVRESVADNKYLPVEKTNKLVKELTSEFSLQNTKSYDVKIVSLDNKTNVAFIKLANMNRPPLSTYIGLVPTNDGSLRYFVLEEDTDGNHMLYERSNDDSTKLSDGIYVDNDFQAFANAVYSIILDSSPTTKTDE